MVFIIYAPFKGLFSLRVKIFQGQNQSSKIFESWRERDWGLFAGVSEAGL